MSSSTNNALRYLHAANMAQLRSFKQLSYNCSLVRVVCGFIHELQKERGVSNVYLASKGEHYSIRRENQVAQSKVKQQQLSALFDKHYLESNQNAENHRLLFGIAQSLEAMEHLDHFRTLVAEHKINARESTQAFCRLIASLTSIVFEAADLASDEKLSRTLIALFNFIQGKEYTGQERAWGSIGFAETLFSEDLCERLRELQELQNDSFGVFSEYASKHLLPLWADLCQHSTTKEIVKLRELIQNLSKGHMVASQISEVWYELCTQRIDQMHHIENLLCEQLVNEAQERVKQTKANVALYNKKVDSLTSLVTSEGKTHIPPLSELPSILGLEQGALSDDGAHQKTDNYLSNHKSLYELLSKQSQRIEEMSSQLALAKQSLEEHKKINRAKLVLIERFKISEADAHKQIQKTAMDKSLSLIEVAENIIEISTH